MLPIGRASALRKDRLTAVTIATTSERRMSGGPAVSPPEPQPRGFRAWFTAFPDILIWCGKKNVSQPEIRSDVVPDRLPFDTVKAWSLNFDKMMKDKNGLRLFSKFLKGEYSDENILFWLAVEELKREKNSEKIEEKARIIYEDFISILSPKEISLDSRVREIVNINMVKPSSTAFDEAQMQIYTLMQRDSYPRFLAWEPYKKMLSAGGTIEES